MASESFPPKNIQSFQEQLLINPRPCFPPEPLVAESSFLARKFELTRKFTDLAPKSSYFFFTLSFSVEDKDVCVTWNHKFPLSQRTG